MAKRRRSRGGRRRRNGTIQTFTSAITNSGTISLATTNLNLGDAAFRLLSVSCKIALSAPAAAAVKLSICSPNSALASAQHTSHSSPCSISPGAPCTVTAVPPVAQAFFPEATKLLIAEIKIVGAFAGTKIEGVCVWSVRVARMSQDMGLL